MLVAQFPTSKAGLNFDVPNQPISSRFGPQFGEFPEIVLIVKNFNFIPFPRKRFTLDRKII